ncbi:DUF2938 domain-containing protein [Mucilaginibacter robiniae]|uniref:DUF2938 domain-containing protein n=1 Tax=Mucilaginibacter robiniae TaxID=2728022 RepID=A0A7L5E7L0_9SPHI|nr:hypothetical protein [Mucilaginibacter robiniae]QJD96853.1 DUF2938 domain-containing protein [Mucilaginibacter robiniae]
MTSVSKIVAGSIVGTSFMTLFSHLVSEKSGKQFNEAEILSELLNRLTPLTKQQARWLGWSSHYLVGVIFATLYAQYLKKAGKHPTITNGAVFGALSGLGGAWVWKMVFKMHPNPPGVDLKNFYKQLVLAHVVFGSSVALVFKADV